jgi:hypothetical protein
MGIGIDAYDGAPETAKEVTYLSIEIGIQHGA